MSERTPPPPPSATSPKDGAPPLVIEPSADARSAEDQATEIEEIEELEELEEAALEEVGEEEREAVEGDADVVVSDDEEVALAAAAGDEADPEEDEGPRAFYVAEAQALAARQPERAALMWLEAAESGAQAGARAAVVSDLDEALELRGESLWLLPRARRLLMRLGEYERAIKIGQREVKLGGDTQTRAGVLLESAAVLHHVLEKGDVALKMLDAALKLQPGNVFALDRAVELRRVQGLDGASAAGLEQLSEHLTDPAQRALALYGAGTVHETILHDVEAAKRAYQRAAEADAQNLPVCVALCDVYRQTNDTAALARALEHLGELLETPDYRGRLLRLAGMLHLDVCGDLDAAARALLRASRATPEDASVWTALSQAQIARGRPREAVESLRRLLALTQDKEGRAALLTQIAQLHAQLHEPERAIAANRDALEEVESYLPALQALGTLYRQRGDYESLIAIAQPQTEGLLPAEARAVRCLDLAEILAERLERPEEAVALCRRAIDLAPELHLAYWALERLLLRLEWHEELATLYGRHADVCEDPETRAERKLRRAAMEAGPLGRPARALEILEALGDQPTRQAIYERIALYDKTGRHADLVELLLAQSEATSDDKEREGRRVQAALFLEQRLGEADRALELYREVLEVNPASYAAIHGTGRILHGLGRWGDLVRLHHHELTIAPERPDTAVLLSRVGRILEVQLGNAGAAIGAYAKALKRDPSYTPALAALDRLARGEKRWTDFVDVLERYAEARAVGQPGQAREAASALTRGGDIAAWVLGALDRAAELYQRAIELDGDHRVARDGLVQVRLRQEEWTDAAVVLEELADASETSEERAALALSLARLVELRLGDDPDIERYDLAAESPFGEQLVEELLRVLRKLGSPRARELQVRIGADATDARLGAAHLLGVAHELEFGPDRASSERDEADDPARLAHERQPDDPAVLWCYERRLQELEDAGGLATLHEREAQLELDRTLRVQALTRAAEAHLLAGQSSHCERLANEALNFDGRCLPALRLLAEVAERAEEWVPLAGILDRLAAASTAPENRLEACLRAATVWQEQVADEARALASLAVALADDPGEARAFERAEGLLRGRRDYDELSRLYQRRIRATDDDADQVELLRAHAELLVGELKMPDRAIAEYEALLSLVPEDAQTLQTVAALHHERGHWSAAAATLERLIDNCHEGEERQRARVDLAQLWLKKLHEPERARQVLEACEAEHPGEEQTVRLRVELAAMVGNWSEAQEALEGLLETTSTPVSVRLWALLRRGEVARVGLHDEALAEASVLAALELAQDDLEGLAALRELCDDKASREHLVAVAEAKVAKEEDLGLRALIGRLLVEDLGERERGVEHLRAVVEASPKDHRAALLYAKALEGKQPRDAAERYRELVAEPEALIAACRGLVRCAPRGTALAAATLVELMGKAGDEEQVQLSALGATLEERTLPVGRFPKEALGSVSDDNLTQSFELLAPYVGELFEHPAGDGPTESLEELGEGLATVLHVGQLQVRRTEGSGALVVAGPPPRLLVGKDLAKDKSEPWKRFLIGRALSMVGPQGIGLGALKEADLEDLFSAIHDKRPTSERGQQLKKQLGKLLPRKTRKALEQLGPPQQTGRFAAFRGTFGGPAERAGLVLGRHPGVILGRLAAKADLALTPKALLGSARLGGLIRFAMSKDYARLYAAVWGG